eukprot:TRINITY_DN360_c1_g2_i1.p1 TRINITY_DN360_c1_g2~~TRINITY_DN360_c1_g2_i1.p1  ORF type:complete len:487 (+),score=177.17 TRINITY_DN360_c1_g2_i1:67-1527(+)
MLSVLCFAAALSAQPHILMLVVDDLGWADVGYQGGNLPSPNINELANNGIKLERYYMQPVCSPTRSAFMTGRYPFHTGMQHLETVLPGSSAGIPATDKTLPEYLVSSGYDTYMIGKWHCGYAKWAQTPTERGFQQYLGYMQAMGDYYNHTVEMGRLSGFDFWLNKERNATVGEYSMTAFMREANTYLHQIAEKNSPSFLYFSHQNMHIPLENPPTPTTECDGVQPAKRKVYCNMMYEVDRAIGELVALYRDLGLWENTLMIFTSDNGGEVDVSMTGTSSGEVGSAGSNWPLRAGKFTLFDGGVRAVGFLQGGDRVIPSTKRGTGFKGLIHAVDWLPTLLEAASLPEQTSDGVSQWRAIMEEGPLLRTEVPINIFDNGKNYTAFISGDWKLIVNPNLNQSTYYDGYWTINPYTWEAPDSVADEYLFNLIDDPNERVNLVGQYPDKVREIKDRIQTLVDTNYVPPQANNFHPEASPNNNGGYWAPFMN